MRIQCVPSRRLSFLAAVMGLGAALVWIAPAVVLRNPALWLAGGVPFLGLAVVFYLRGRRIPVAEDDTRLIKANQSP